MTTVKVVSLSFAQLSLLLALGVVSTVSAQSGIMVTPPVNFTVPLMSEDNLTYACVVSGDRQAIWDINGRQVGQSSRDDFESVGVIITGSIRSNSSELTLTPMSRNIYFNLNQSTIQIQCIASDNVQPVSEFGEVFFVVTYGVPFAPPNFRLNPDPNRLSRLTVLWDRPPNIPEGVPVNYTVSISGPRVNENELTSDTMYVFNDEESETCQEHTFSVVATNPAGPGVVTSLEETIPISPNLLATGDGLRLGVVNLEGNSVSFEVFFPLASTCSDTNFPITNHSVVVSQNGEIVARRSYIQFAPGQPSNMPLVIAMPELVQDQRYGVSVEACISITCRSTQSVPLVTSDIQEVSLTFFENNIFMTCVFADTVTSQGCVFNLTLANGTELFFLRRADAGDAMVGQCNVSSSQRMAYTSIQVMDWESDGTFGTLSIPIPMPVLVEQEMNYTRLTSCVIERPGLSGGAIAGIVLAIIAFVIIAVAIAIVVAILVYKLRTGKWFKLRHKDEGKLTVDFEKSWLIDDQPERERTGSLRRMFSLGKASVQSLSPKRKTNKEEGVEEPVDTPDGPEESPTAPTVSINSMTPHMGITSGTAAAVSTMEPTTRSISLVPQQPLSSLDLSINPSTAFTMDIIDDKKVRLHLNKALIRQVLKANNISIDKIGRKGRPRGQRRIDGMESRPLLSLAMTSEVRAIKESTEEPAITKQEESIDSKP